MHQPNCPFCPFSDWSSYSLAQHVETVHPETDQPSFVPRAFLKDHGVEDVYCKETATARDAPSGYFDCECGEAIPFSEFDDHVQLHSAESADMAVDAAEPLGILKPPPSLAPKSKQHSSHSTTRHHHHHTVKDWVTLLLAANAAPSRTRVDPTKHKRARRLGVSHGSTPRRWYRLIYVTES